MVPDDSDRMGGVTSDPAQIESWARETGTIPINENGDVRLVDEDTFDEDSQTRLDWDDFSKVITESDRLVCRERDHLQVRHRDDTVVHLESQTSQKQFNSVDMIAGPDAASGAATPRPPIQSVTETPASSDAAEPEQDRETGRRSSVDDRNLERIIPTSDDQGKTVVSTDGTKLGVVAAVDDDHIYVGSRPSLFERVLSKIGLGDGNEVSFVLDSDTISQIDDDRIVVAASSK